MTMQANPFEKVSGSNLRRRASKADVVVLAVLVGVVAWLLSLAAGLLGGDPLRDHGTAVLMFRSEEPGEVRLFSVESAGREHRPRFLEEDGWTVAMMGGVLVQVTAPAGPLEATLRYRVGEGGAVRQDTVGFTLRAGHSCDVEIRLTLAGPEAAPCANHQPGSQGGQRPL